MKTNGKAFGAAKSQDVLGPGFDFTQVPAEWRRHYQRLLVLRNEFLRDVDDLEQDARSETLPFSMHMGDAGTDNFDHDLALSLLASEQNALQEIDAALQRIREGRYGICESSGAPIPRGRLNAIPWARYTLEAQADVEEQGQAPRAHLNPLSPVFRAQPVSSE